MIECKGWTDCGPERPIIILRLRLPEEQGRLDAILRENPAARVYVGPPLPARRWWEFWQ